MKRKIALIGLLIGCCLFVLAPQIAAHGGGELIAGPIAAGPYTLSVWVNPPIPRAADAIHYTVGVASPEDGQPVLDAEIMVEMVSTGNSTLAASAPATTEQSINKLFYETDVQVSEPGLYETTFFVAGPAGEGSLAVDIMVEPPSRINWLVIGLTGLAVIIIAGWWRTRRSTKSQNI